MSCKRCHGRGLVEVSYASAENGPKENPEDERGIEFCECETGYKLWKLDCEKNETENEEFFASMSPYGSPVFDWLRR